MIRHTKPVRANWQSIVEGQGLTYHTVDGQPYYDESVYYEFNAKQIDQIEADTNEIHRINLEAVQNVIDNHRYDELQIPEVAIPLIEWTWNNETPAVYGRYDLHYDGKNPSKMLENNGDTPTGLIEAAVIQWFWLEECFKGKDQFNSIHERLIAKWKELVAYLLLGPLHLTHMDSNEDYMNVKYMEEVASQAGLKTKCLPIEEIGWDKIDQCFLDEDLSVIRNIFKLYPWEWLLKDRYAANMAATMKNTYWIEPAWKMILSNKGILPILWELNPGHPNLLPAYFNQNCLNEYVKKPLFSREGANIEIVAGDASIKTLGKYGTGKYIYQQYCAPPNFDGNYPVIGSWVIDGESAGIGIRESNTLVTGNFSRFVPHLFN